MARILIIDDDPALRSTVTKILARSGHEVRESEDGEQGVAAFLESPLDLVITDLVMPRKEGMEVITEIRSRDKTVKILAVSGCDGGAAAGHLAEARERGANEALPKPFTVDQLRNAVAALLSR